MFYNERITTDATPSVKIYEGNQGQAMMKEGAELKKQASNEIREAKKMEQTALELGISKGMNELWQNEALQSNPKALAEEMDKLAENVTSKTTDTDLKVKVLADFQLKKDSYINQSITRMKKIEEEKRKSALFDSIYSSIDSAGMAFGNGVSGSYTDEDVVNFKYSMDKIKANINARNPDGTYVFSDAQRRAMSKDIEEANYQAFKTNFDTLSSVEKQSVKERLGSDSYSIMLSDGGSVNVRDIVGAEKYNKMKDYVKEDEYRQVALEEKRIKLEKSKQQIEQYNTEMALSDQLDDMDALDALKVLDEKQDIVSDKYYKAKRKSLLSSKGIDAETQADTAAEIALDIAAINPEKAKDFFKQSNEVLTKIEDRYASGELSFRDKRMYTNQLMKRQGKNLPTLVKEESGWFKSYDYSDAQKDLQAGLFNTSNVNKALLEYSRTINDERESDKYEKAPSERKNLIKALINKYNGISMSNPEPQKIGKYTVRIK